MNSRAVVEIDIDRINVGERLRVVDAAHVEMLAAAIDARGLLSPIEVTEAADAGRYDLIAGAHRLAAVRKNGSQSIFAFVREVANGHERQLIEIEENLLRYDLTTLDRAVFLTEWKRLYNEMTGARGRGRPAKETQTTLSDFPLRFSEAVSLRLHMTPRNLDRAIKRAALQPTLRAALAGHPAADHGALLDALLKLDAAAQDEIAIELENRPDLPIPDLRRLITGDAAPAKARDRYEAFILLWEKMNADEKRRVRAFIAPRSGRGE